MISQLQPDSLITIDLIKNITIFEIYYHITYFDNKKGTI